jgi:hypothetical protein
MVYVFMDLCLAVVWHQNRANINITINGMETFSFVGRLFLNQRILLTVCCGFHNGLVSLAQDICG